MFERQIAAHEPRLSEVTVSSVRLVAARRCNGCRMRARDGGRGRAVSRREPRRVGRITRRSRAGCRAIPTRGPGGSMRPTLAGPRAQIVDGLVRGGGVERAAPMLSLDHRENFCVDELRCRMVRVVRESPAESFRPGSVGDDFGEHAGVNHQHSATLRGSRRARAQHRVESPEGWYQRNTTSSRKTRSAPTTRRTRIAVKIDLAPNEAPRRPI